MKIQDYWLPLRIALGVGVLIYGVPTIQALVHLWNM